MENIARLYNGQAWKDTDGHTIRAHGGWMLQQDGYYYWFGEDRTDGKKVSCYRSSDLSCWENRGAVLTLKSKVRPTYYRTSLEMYSPDQEDIGYGQGAVIERPKVLRNERTGKYVMWMHWENGRDYHDARCAVATCDTIDGDYVYHGSFNPIGYMSRDCTVFQDDDGSAYFISAARDNADLLVYRLSDDYLSIDEHVKTLWPGQYREAPAVMKRNGVYFLITSACTGWLPNQGTYAYADSLTGKWSQLLPFGDSTTYDSQPAFIMPLQVQGKTEYLYVGDRWDPSSYHDSTYVFLPLSFPMDKEMKVDWADHFTLNHFTDSIENTLHSGMHRIKSCGAERYLAVQQTAGEEAAVNGKMLSYLAEEQKWIVEQAEDDGYVLFKNVFDGRYLAASLSSDELPEGDGKVLLVQKGAHGCCCEWALKDADDEGKILIRNRMSGKVLSTRNRTGESLAHPSVHVEEAVEHDPRKGRDPQLFEILAVY